jgi:hypothetical protein
MLEGLSLPKKVFPCRIRTVKEAMTPADQKILDDAVMNPEWPYKTLSNELSKRDVKVSDVVLKNHREKRCSCWKA